MQKNLELVYNCDTSEYEDKNAVVINADNKADSQLWKFEKQSERALSKTVHHSK